MIRLSKDKEILKQKHMALFAKNLQKVMLVKGINQKDIADRTEITPAYVSMLVRGLKEPRLSTIKRLCKALNIKPHTLLGR